MAAHSTPDAPAIRCLVPPRSLGLRDNHLEQLTLRDTARGSTETVHAQWLYLFIGAQPLTDWLDGVVAGDSKGS